VSKEYWINHFCSEDTELQSLFLNLSIESCSEILVSIGRSNSEGITYESAENRVFGFQDIVIKFYRPGRWSLRALEEELQFLEELHDGNVAFVRPIGKVRTWNGLHYIVFERIKEPIIDKKNVLDEDSVRKMVHLVAEVHKVGRKSNTTDRPIFNPKSMSEGCFEIIKKEGYLPHSLYDRYEAVINQLISKVNSFGDIPVQRIHGDTYTGNVLWKPEGPIFMDLDDFQVGPVAIDVKLLSFPWRLDRLSEDMDRRERRDIQQQMVLKFYREVSDFPKEWEKLFPLLSVYRDIQFDAWFSARWRDPGFSKQYEDDDITQEGWWLDNIQGLEDLIDQ
jgi:Ser/Thr protein kinase RdoA (MazF antagonist)